MDIHILFISRYFIIIYLTGKLNLDERIVITTNAVSGPATLISTTVAVVNNY